MTLLTKEQQRSQAKLQARAETLAALAQEEELSSEDEEEEPRNGLSGRKDWKRKTARLIGITTVFYCIISFVGGTWLTTFDPAYQGSNIIDRARRSPRSLRNAGTPPTPRFYHVPLAKELNSRSESGAMGACGSRTFAVPLAAVVNAADASAACAALGYTLADITNANILTAAKVVQSCVASNPVWVHTYNGDTYNAPALTLTASATGSGSINAALDIAQHRRVLCHNPTVARRAPVLTAPIEDSTEATAVTVMTPNFPNSKVKGYIKMYQNTVDIVLEVRITGLPANSKNGLAIHEYGDVYPDCSSAGKHFNPRGTIHGASTEDLEHRHVGDLGNIVSGPDGGVTMVLRDPYIKLQGPESVLGRAFVILSMHDDGTTQPYGAPGGRRESCGVIGTARTERYAADGTDD
ncbi:hypothetical protein HKX48_008054 [Thoreauomyces humboldtii]|nr:hypothetical protein HKX48_008054 [Thoreauomyces humboldtii]